MTSCLNLQGKEQPVLLSQMLLHYLQHLNSNVWFLKDPRQDSELSIYVLPCVYLFWVLHRFQHFKGHITTGSLWTEETSPYSWKRFCTVNCQP